MVIIRTMRKDTSPVTHGKGDAKQNKVFILSQLEGVKQGHKASLLCSPPYSSMTKVGVSKPIHVYSFF